MIVASIGMHGYMYYHMQMVYHLTISLELSIISAEFNGLHVLVLDILALFF
jgi:hypothetical protein